MTVGPLTPKEFLAIISVVLGILLSLSFWMPIPHRMNQVEAGLADHETRLRKIEDIRIDLSEMRSDIREIKKRLDQQKP